MYNKNINYIGNAAWQYKITDKLYERFGGINYTAYWHDKLYGELLYKEKGIITQFLLKMVIDLVFLIMGCARSLRKFKIHGIIITFVLYLCLLVSTPVIIYKQKNL